MSDPRSSCMVCGSVSSRPFLNWQERLWLTCDECGLCWVDKPPFERPSDLYAENYYATQTGRLSNGWWDYDYGARHQFQWILDECAKRVTQGTLLDIGCGGGSFMKLARDRGYEVAGVELARQAREKAEGLLGKKVNAVPLEECGFPPGSFDIVSLNNVLEHLPDPRATLDEIYRILRPGGLLTISVPNAVFGKAVLAWLSPVARFLRRPDPICSAAVFDASMHVYAFSPGALELLQRSSRFREIEMFNEVPVANYGRHVRNTVKWSQYRVATMWRRVTGNMLGHGITSFARKP